MKKTDLIKELLPIYANHIEQYGCVIVDVLMGQIIDKAVVSGMSPPECQRKMTKEELEGFNKLFKYSDTGLLDEDDTITDFCWEDET